MTSTSATSPAAKVDEDFVQRAVTEFAAKFKTEAEQVVHAVAKTARDHANARQSLMDQRDHLQEENARLKTALFLLQQTTREVTKAELFDCLNLCAQNNGGWPLQFETITEALRGKFILLPRPVVSLVEGEG